MSFGPLAWATPGTVRRAVAMAEPRWISGIPIIDMHCHVFDHGYLPASLQDATARAWAGRRQGRKPEDVRGKLDANMADPSAAFMLADMDAAQVDVSVTVALDTGYGFPDEPAVDAISVMEHYAQLQKSTDGRVLGFAGVDPRRPGAAKIV